MLNKELVKFGDIINKRSLLNNKGNFIEFYHLRPKNNDIIAQYFIEKEKNYRYIRPDFQNTFLSLMAKNIL